jgi:DNA-binding CsgD family transcriptional regulator
MPLRPGPLVGRDTDVARLSDAAGVSRTGPGSVVLSGDAGIGKSRLVARLSDDAAALGWRTLVGHCVGQAGSTLAYLPFVELLGTVETEAPEVLEEVLSLHPALTQLVPGRGLSVASPGDTVDPGVVATSVHALLTALGADRPTLVTIEDVHWADHSSRDLLTLLLTRGFTTPVGLVVTYRSDDLHRRHALHETLAVWARIAGVEHLELGPLEDTEVHELLAELGDPGGAAVASEIARRSEGNPFFIEELAASAAAGQTLSGGLTRVLRARVEQLDPDGQQLVRALAVGGRQIGHDLLARVVDLPDDRLESAVANAVEHHVIEACWPPAYTFRHALLGEAVADGLLPGERLRLHRAYAAVLADRPDLAPPSELAMHAAATGDFSVAVSASRAAAEAALAVGGPQDALGQLVPELGSLVELGPVRDDVALADADAAALAGDPLRAVNLLHDRLDHPGRGQSRKVRADLLARYVLGSRILDLPHDPLGLTAEAVELVGTEPSERRVRVLTARLQALVDSARLADASEVTAVTEEVTSLAQDLELPRALAEVRTILIRLVERRHDLDAVEEQLHTLLSQTTDDDPVRVRLLHRLGSARFRRGDLQAALATYDEGARVAAQLRMERAPFGLECRLLGGLLAYQLGDWDGALTRWDLGTEPLPETTRLYFLGSRLAVVAGRGEPVDPEVLTALRASCRVVAIPAVDLATAGVLLGQAGRIEAALDLATDILATVDLLRGTRQPLAIRLSALVAGQCARAAALGADARLRRRMLEVTATLLERAESLAVSPETDAESWAWLARARAEGLRLRWLLDETGPDGGPVTSEALVAVWAESVAAFERYGEVFETARSEARLAAALHAAGDEDGSRQAAARARVVAERLGAQPLLAELEGILPSRTEVSGIPDLTPREAEVLGLVARGLSNGQIGRRLYISTKTVSVHVSNLLAKLGAASRTEAAAVARDAGLLD